MVRVSRCTQVFFTQSLYALGVTVSQLRDDTLSPSLQACANISRPSISKLSLNWTSVPSTIFLSSAFLWISGNPKIAAIQIEQIERDQHDLGRLALELVLQHREIGRAVGGRHHDLAVDDGGARLDVPGIVGDLLEAVGPVVAPPGEDLGRLVGQMDLDPVAVELDFVNPALSGRHLLDRGCQGRFDEAGQGAFTPMAAGFLR